jgi:hypothetical protein
MKLEDVILIGDRASQPAANTVPIGTLYSVTDESNIVERSDGAAWATYAGAGGGGGAPDTSTYLTDADETGDLPNSRRLLAGTGITFDDATPGERTIEASGGGGGLFVEIDITLTNAEIIQLTSAPVLLLPAVGAGMTAIPLLMFIRTNFSAAAYDTPFTPNIYLDGFQALFTGTPFEAAEDRTYSECAIPTLLFRFQADNCEFYISADADTTGGDAANEMYVKVVYMLQSVAE